MYLFTFGFLIRKNRELFYNICNHFGFIVNKLIETIIPEIPLAEILGSNHTVSIAESNWIQGNATTYELITFASFVKKYNPKTIFEMGTFDGRTTLNLALNSSPETKIYTIDLQKNEPTFTELPVLRTDQGLINTNVTGSRFQNSDESLLPAKKKITQLYGDTATFNFSPYFSSIDLIFVDAAHTYEYVVNDTEIALKLLRNGRGIILWHDYDFSPKKGVVKALNELQEKHPDWKIYHIKDTNTACLIKG
jgi:predicted O-methyltransferase YrrM